MRQTRTSLAARTVVAEPTGPPRRLRGVVSIRDIRDVEQLVTTTLERLSLPVDGERSDRLVLAGVDAVFRIDRSVPREHPLGPILDGVLEQGLLDLASELPQVAAAGH